MRILVVEDDRETGRLLKSSFEKEFFCVDLETDGDRGSFMARTNEYDVLILDKSLPGKDGTEILKELRSGHRSTPIIMLTVHSDISEKLCALDLGADDYVIKPFVFGELLSRVRAVLRRPGQIKEEIFCLGKLTLDVKKQSLVKNGKQIYLTKKEFQLLEFLARNPGRVVSRGMIMEHVWDSEIDPFSNTIETHMVNLRRKIGEKGMIRTFSGRGYKLEI